MQSFVSGKEELILPEILRFVDVNEDTALWIPRHMQSFIEMFAIDFDSKVTQWRKDILKEIFYTFESFKNYDEDEDKGKAWEKLFKTVILIRLFGGLYDKVILPLDDAIFRNCTVSYNSFIKSKLDLREKCDNLSDLLKLVRRPSEFPHVAVYYPPNLSFKVYDMFVIAYKSKDDEPQIYGYQLKLGKEDAKKGISLENDQCCKRFWIRGKAPKTVMKGSDGDAIWHKATDSEIENLFGVSGVNWTPKVWAKLTGKK